MVAPFTGAWIEISLLGCLSIAIVVAPFTGAWIEIFPCVLGGLPAGSLPSRERGLKYTKINEIRDSPKPLPSRERRLGILLRMALHLWCIYELPLLYKPKFGNQSRYFELVRQNCILAGTCIKPVLSSELCHALNSS